ncbi:MAG TPA: alpha/beta hydrolase [Ramlibacter sp.]|nr:alpha/beta hydrolase [Ramlibacter sp.]
MYQERNPSRSAFVPIRGLRYHVREWGQPLDGQAPLVLVHGWMDVSASWQFMVDCLRQQRWVIAPDWRGYGLSQTPPGADQYWLPDYLADLDFLLEHYSPAAPVDLVGHSMGGNLAMLYAGSRPARIRRLVNLEGFGMAPMAPEQAPVRLGQWMDELKEFHRGEVAVKPYDGADGVAQRLMKTNRRLPRDKADWLARHWARPGEDGLWRILADPAHKITNAQVYRLEEVLAHYRAITAPTLCVEASDDSLALWWKGRYTLEQFRERVKNVADARHALVRNAGHMLHHDQPEELAQLIEDFTLSR